MSKTVTVLSLLITLAALATGAAYMLQNPATVTLTWGDQTLSTPEPVAILLILMATLGVFYSGQLMAWLMRLPTQWATAQASKTQSTLLTTLAEAFVAAETANLPLLKKKAKTLPSTSPFPAETALIHLAQLKAGVLQGQQAEEAITHPLTGSLIATALAQQAAGKGNWPEVRRLTRLGLDQTPTSPALLALQFKACVNLSDATTETLLPALKPLLGPTPYTLLTQITKGFTNTQGRNISHPWVKAYHAWLSTAEALFPPFKGD